MGFTFKQFHVNDDQCGMKVSTDSVLLGAWAQVEEGETILDIGTGSGLLSLMASQRGAGHVLGIELDGSASQQAQANVAASPWPTQIDIVNTGLEAFCESSANQFQHIISNPPYFESGLVSPCQKRGSARHGLSFETLFRCASQLLAPSGKMSLVLPTQAWLSAQQASQAQRLYPTRVTQVTTRPNKPVKLMLIELSRAVTPCQTESLLIHSEAGQYSTSFKRLTADFYLNG
ncbi:tRNA1(Val) (adenine(37)-N6)-methyltransferase [Ferrimonas aestuarii]|nr:methyltransferase [Ferrimonas aestuarii]